MVESRVYRWADGTFVEDEWCDPHAGNVLVADSWLVVDGAAVTAARHARRFLDGVTTNAPGSAAEAFIRDAVGHIPRDGRWFPRIEAVNYGDGALFRLHVRPAPEPETTITLATATRDPRTQPSIKGPDLAALGLLRRESNAGEAVILDDGRIVEGAWSSIIWWSNEGIHRVAPSIPRLTSVTERALLDIAARCGTPVIDSTTTPAELDGAEVWTLSALHGIRVATDWANGPAVSMEPGRAEFWRRAYSELRTPLGNL